MSKFDDVVKYDDPQALKTYKRSSCYIEWLRSKEALEDLPEYYGKLWEKYNALWENFDELRREKNKLEGRVATLESEKNKLEGKVATLENEKTKLQREKINLETRVATLESEKANLETQYASMREANRKLTENNPYTAGGDSATTYLQWIERYITLLQDYNDKVYDVVTQTDDNIAAIRDLVVQILEEGFSAGALSPDTKTSLQNVDRFLDPKYCEGTQEYKSFVQFFDDLIELARQAENYKDSFHISVPFRDSHFDQRYVRLPGLERPRKQVDKNKGKKITRCYLPSVLFFFTSNYLAACAPGLVAVEEPKRPASPPSDGRYYLNGEFANSQGQKSSQRGDFTNTTSVSTSVNNDRHRWGKK